MPRRNHDPLAGDAARAARHRLRARLAPEEPADQPLLPQASFPELQEETSDAGRANEHDRGTARFRWRVPWRVPALLLVPVVLLGLWLGWQAWSGTWAGGELLPSAGTEVVGTASDAAVAGGTPSADATEGLEGSMVVHVAGAVKKPGIVRLPVGSRVFEAIAAAGGAVDGAALDSLNLAAVIQDGAKVHVPRPGEAPAANAGGGNGSSGTGAPGGGSAAHSGDGGKVNINSASVEELDSLPRVGPVLAERIVAWREEHGPFAAVEELDAVDGVGPKMLEALLPLVTV
ncbi:hypothetical protein BIU82_05320 [Arthrobacter sp. SW1]|uniref:ComEA family DNA-binding protein n=1 Tax=Arthrobacter sp. SW1 TaxID=1920889 RepID=UPI000877DD14|nr:ComEA family DNA-binding protein [Arthrobacter sp. SW1]OFI37926.1 hypothetical protein BIU82_05320 [Arthrobacter sp. SW1]